MQGLLEYLCKSSVHLRTTILNKLAADTATTGMELLWYGTIMYLLYSSNTYETVYSVSSSYQDLMPQFLRAIRMLCTLYKYYIAAYKTLPPNTIISTSVPSSPGSEGPGDRAVVKRTNSFGSLLDSPRPERNRRRFVVLVWNDLVTCIVALDLVIKEHIQEVAIPMLLDGESPVPIPYHHRPTPSPIPAHTYFYWIRLSS